MEDVVVSRGRRVWFPDVEIEAARTDEIIQRVMFAANAEGLRGRRLTGVTSTFDIERRGVYYLLSSESRWAAYRRAVRDFFGVWGWDGPRSW